MGETCSLDCMQRPLAFTELRPALRENGIFRDGRCLRCTGKIGAAKNNSRAGGAGRKRQRAGAA